MNKVILILILTLAFLLRSYHLTSIPSINPDEAAIAYNAYSLLETGKDEHGNSWPIHFKSFGDYKPGGYFYLSLPFIKLLGLNTLAVRLPNLILSILTIFYFYQLIYLLSKSKKLALISSFFLTISPWHIHFSRGAWESSVALSFLLIGTYYLIVSIRNNISAHIYISILLFSASLYTYHSARLIAPLLFLTLTIDNLKIILSNYKKIIFPVIFGLVITLPVLFSFIKDGGAERFGGVGITADQGPIWRTNELLNHHQGNNILIRVAHNKVIAYTLSWADKYLSHFELNFLFLKGDEVPRSKSPDFGQLYLFEILLIPFGIHYLFTHKKNKKLLIIVTFSWLFISPVAASLTFQAPSALRALPMVIPLVILSSSGVAFFLNKYPKSLILIILIFLASLAAYIDSYFIRSPKRYPFAWNYKFNELVPYLEQEKSQYDHVYITDKYDQPYILFLFFSKYSPSQIQQDISLTKPDQFGFQTVPTYDKYIFGHINWPDIPDNSLVVAADEIIPHGPHKIINFDNNQPAFKIYIK